MTRCGTKGTMLLNPVAWWTEGQMGQMVPQCSQKWQHGCNIDATWNVTRVQWIWSRSWASLATSWSSIVTAWVGACSCGSASSWRPSASWFACCGWAATSGLSMGNTWEHDGTYTTNLQLRTDWEWSTTNAITVMWFPHLSHQTFDSLGQMPNTTFTGVLAKQLWMSHDLGWPWSTCCRVLVVLG